MPIMGFTSRATWKRLRRASVNNIFLAPAIITLFGRAFATWLHSHR
jgi:hypothetical protein